MLCWLAEVHCWTIPTLSLECWCFLYILLYKHWKWNMLYLSKSVIVILFNICIVYPNVYRLPMLLPCNIGRDWNFCTIVFTYTVVLYETKVEFIYYAGMGCLTVYLVIPHVDTLFFDWMIQTEMVLLKNFKLFKKITF